MTTVIDKRTISGAAAFKAVGVAVEKGLQLGCRINAAVVDGGGNLLAFRRADGGFLHSIGIAQDKAYTAAGFGAPTGLLYEIVKDAVAVREGLLQRDRLVLFGGGHPIVVEGEVIGGIGCSGGSEEEDSACALAGLAAIGLVPPDPHPPAQP